MIATTFGTAPLKRGAGLGGRSEQSACQGFNSVLCGGAESGVGGDDLIRFVKLSFVSLPSLSVVSTK
jgi:hypothetical protein